MTPVAWIRVCGFHKDHIEHMDEEEKGPTTALCQVVDKKQCASRASYDIKAVLKEVEA